MHEANLGHYKLDEKPTYHQMTASGELKLILKPGAHKS